LGVAADLAALERGERRRWVAWLRLYATLVILITAVPFADAVLGAGALVGISPYLLAYAAGVASGPLPPAGRERVELLLTVGVALYAVAALVRLRLSRGDSSIMLALFSAQLLVATVFTRFVLAVVFWAVAIDVLVAERREVRALFIGARAAAQCARRVP
jgi:hypothetical protein